MITCSVCKTIETEKWYFRKTPLITKCKKCYDHFRHAVYSKKRITFKGKRIHLKENPRKGKCKLCGSTIKRTAMHHIRYCDEDPLKYTMETCDTCHTKEGWRLKQYENKVNNWNKYLDRDPETGRYVSKRHN